MKKIKAKNPEELKKKTQSKKPRIISRMLLAITSLAGVSSLVNGVNAQIRYYGAKKSALESNVPKIISELPDEEKVSQLYDYYASAIESNPNMNDTQKATFIEGFGDYVISWWGQFFDEDTIANMYAVASTQKVSEMSEFANTHSWWSGDYGAFFNSISINDETDPEIAAHEQLHGITKGNFYTVGLSEIMGIGVNEGMTGMMCDYTYPELAGFTKKIGAVIGYDKLLDCYLNHNHDKLLQELNRYISSSESKKLLKDMDKYTYLQYADIFRARNNGTFGEKIDEAIWNCELEIESLLDKLKDNAINKGFTIDYTQINKYSDLILSDSEYVYRKKSCIIYGRNRSIS